MKMDSFNVAPILAYMMPYYNMDKRIKQLYDRINERVNKDVTKVLSTRRLGIYEVVSVFDDKIPNPRIISSMRIFDDL